MIKFVLFNFYNKVKNNILIIIELTIVFIISNILLNQLIPFIYSQNIYNKLNLSNIICFTTVDKNDNIITEKDMIYLGQTIQGEQRINSKHFLQPVSKTYFDYITYGYVEHKEAPCKHNHYDAIVVRSLSNDYKYDETYTIETELNNQITFHVVGILNNDFVFVPPTDYSTSSIVEQHKNTILLIENENTSNQFKYTNTHLAWANNKNAVKTITMNLMSDKNVLTAMNGIDAYDYISSLELEMMGMPLILFLVSFVLCFTGFLSHVLLSLITFKRKYSIYYICGAQKKDCVLIQVLTDFIPFLISIFFACVFLLVLELYSSMFDFTIETFFVSVLCLLVVFILVEIIGVSQMKNTSISENIERRY